MSQCWHVTAVIFCVLRNAVGERTEIYRQTTHDSKSILHLHQASRVSEEDVIAFASMANLVYEADLSKKPDIDGGWSLKHAASCDTSYWGKKRIAVWGAEDGRCAMAFEGTTHIGDVIMEFDLAVMDWCGIRNVHKGFATGFDAILNCEHFAPMPEIMGSKNCSAGRIVTGHSLGGALASLAAACGQRASGTMAKLGFKADMLYTFGAPAVSKGTKLQVPGGGRFFNFNKAAQKPLIDPVPVLLNYLAPDWFHPQIVAFRLENNGSIVVEKLDALAAPTLPKVVPTFTDVSGNALYRKLPAYVTLDTSTKVTACWQIHSMNSYLPHLMVGCHAGACT